VVVTSILSNEIFSALYEGCKCLGVGMVILVDVQLFFADAMNQICFTVVDIGQKNRINEIELTDTQ
jgi:hypothetical protein